MSEWVNVALGQVSEIIDSRHKTPEYSVNGYPMVRVVDVKGGALDLSETKKVDENVYADFSKGRNPEIGDIVISRVGSYGVVSYVASNEKFCLGQNTAMIVPKGINCDFLYYQLVSPLIKHQIEQMVVGAVQKTISLKSINQLNILLPSEKEQKRIADILRTLDNKITLNRQINQTLEDMAQAIFKSWFVDFEPVKAKMSALAVGGSADDANLAAMSAISGKTTEQLLTLKTTHPDQFQQLYTTADLFPSEMVDSELGEIPKGWEVKAFGDVIDKYIDNRGKTPPLVDDGIPLLEVKHLTETSAFPNLKADKKISEDTYNTWFRAHVQEKDILISTVGTIGRTSFVKDTNLAIAQNVLGLRFSEKVTPEYMFYLIKDSNFQHGVNSRLVITVQSSIKRKDLNTISLLVPSNNIVMHFSSKISDNLNAQFSLYKEIEFLIDLRDALLPKLLSGELSLINDNFKEST